MTKKKTEATLTQAFEAATVAGTWSKEPDADPIVDVVDDDPTLVMPRSELDILCQVSSKAP